MASDSDCLRTLARGCRVCGSCLHVGSSFLAHFAASCLFCFTVNKLSYVIMPRASAHDDPAAAWMDDYDDEADLLRFHEHDVHEVIDDDAPGHAKRPHPSPADVEQLLVQFIVDKKLEGGVWCAKDTFGPVFVGLTRQSTNIKILVCSNNFQTWTKTNLKLDKMITVDFYQTLP